MTMPPRLTVVGDLERPDHSHLPADARCYFWGEYTPHEHTDGRKWTYSPTNQLIGNFKKKMDRSGQSDWRYKRDAIDTVARAFSQMWRWSDLQQHNPALIPMPPSRSRADPLFDPRMLEVLNLMAARIPIPIDIRDCLTFSGVFVASHESDERPTPEDLFGALQFDMVGGKPDLKPGVIFLYDDMLTTGAHFVAATRRLAVHFPGVQVVGTFVARRRVPNPFAAFE